MQSYIWTVIYIVGSVWLITRLLAFASQWLLRRYAGVTVKIDRIGLFSCKKVQLLVKKGLSVEIERAWLTSCFFNHEIKKPVVICIEGIRIQADVHHDDRPVRTNQRAAPVQNRNADFTLPKLATYAQYLGLKINTITVMLLKTMIPDCLVHLEAQTVDLDIKVIEQCYDLSLDVVGVSCRALRSVEQQELNIEPCLAGLSLSTFINLKAQQENIKHLKLLRFLVSKPQATMTETFLSILQDVRQSQVANVLVAADENGVEQFPIGFERNFIPQEIGIDVTELDVKIVRETKQRTLSVGLRTFHVEYHEHSNFDDQEESFCGLLVEGFHTWSPQAKFAELLKLNTKVVLGADTADAQTVVNGAYFHYHHEEVQYWSTVISRISSREQSVPNVVNRDIHNTEQSSSLRMVMNDYLRTHKLKSVINLSTVSSGLSSASCPGLHFGIHSCTLTCETAPAVIEESGEVSVFHDLKLEIDVKTIHCQQADSHVAVEKLNGKCHYWDHPLYIGTLYFKLRRLGNEVNTEGLVHNTQIEWSTNLLNILLQFLSSIQRRRSYSGEITLPNPSTNTRTIPQWKDMTFSSKLEIANVNVFLTNNYKVCLMLRIDIIEVDYSPPHSTVLVEACKVVYMHLTDKFTPVTVSSELENPAVHIQEVRVSYKHQQQEMGIRITKTLMCSWETFHHMCIIQAIEDFTDLHSKLTDRRTPTEQAKSVHPPSEFKTKVNVVITAQTSLTLYLSKRHRVSLVTDSLLMKRSPEEVLMEIKWLAINCDEHKIFDIKGILFATLSDYSLANERRSHETLTLKNNRVWNIALDKFHVIFPFKYNFATCFEEFVNLFKWWKLVHHVKRKPFTVDSKLPPDLKIKVKVFMIQLSDDPFEVKLGDNYDLLKDECFEDIKRQKVLENKIQSLRKTHGIIPANRVQELYATLAKKSSEIYIQRSRQLYTASPMRSKLFTWTMEGLEIIALADLSFHGKENVVKHMKDIDHESPYPEDGLDFLTLWCRMMMVSLDSWTIMLRDYPQPMLEVKDMRLWGRLIGAEQDGTRRAKRSCVVEVNEPWNDMTVERNLPALKFYHDFTCDVVSWVMAYGACWEPGIAQYNTSLDLINKPSVDPSHPLPWWDKSRILLHGRLTMSVKQMSWLYHASFDPYNTTEMMDWLWSDVIMDWTNAKVVLKGDLDIYARTASKYDDCKLLHLPNLRLCIRLEWLCLGDPNDHHSVMPCAPDKIPDYSMEEHDSFRAFRSQNLNLEISLDTKPLRDTTLNVPSCLFFASTIRFLDKIKMCMLAVTRPIRRGRHFGNTKPRKLQLTRHYKTIKMAINLHRFNICYWMSFSKQHGSELLAESFLLHLCNDLTLIPIEDGLFHRPQANWSVRYLHCELTAAKTWLQSAKSTPDQLNVSFRTPVDKSFFISVSRVMYKRGHLTDPNEEEEEVEASKHDKSSAVHNVQVHGMKGAWTKHNRTVLIGLYDSYQKAQSQKKNLSADALKVFKMEHPTQKNRSSSITAGQPSSPTTVTPSPLSKLQTRHALSMLMKLVAESDSKSVAFTEEQAPSSTNMEQLHGVAACQTDDVICKNWLIELHNSQIMLKGVETSGHIIVSAAKAQVLSCTHNPVWKNNQLRSKTSWVGSIECMQYYATVDPDNKMNEDCYAWLSPENVEDRLEEDLTGLPEMVSSGHSVGGVVYSTYSNEKKSSKESIQLQRIISRCKCQIFYASYGEVDLDQDQNLEIPLPPSEDSDMFVKEEGVDTFTLLHHDLNVCTNHLQYNMILDVVNNLLLHVEQKKKETTEKLQSMRFQLQLSKVEDQKTPIQIRQEDLREQCEELRRLEKELYVILKALDDDEDNEILTQQSEELEQRLSDCKELINMINEELTIRISCLKESQLYIKTLMKTTKAQQASVDRRNEVCFKFAHWRLTETDGQLGITDLVLRNFVYSKVNRDNDTWTHQVELGWVKVTNLLPNSIYKDVLVPRDTQGQESDRQMALRITCSERPPVNGIAVKEHFEVNLVPLQIQMTYQFYKTVMLFFFPDKNIDADGHDNDAEGGNAHKKAEKKSSGKKESVKRTPSSHNFDDIDKMKERAAKNNTFYYVKIPEVSLRVSYKGEKEKNIEDIRDFSIVLPTLEYHNSIWTWFDMLMFMKNDTKRVILSQAIKQKLHMRSRAGEETPLTDVQQEEDKMKMLLGAKLLAGQDKPTKKSLFGKSQKQ